MMRTIIKLYDPTYIYDLEWIAIYYHPIHYIPANSISTLSASLYNVQCTVDRFVRFNF